MIIELNLEQAEEILENLSRIVKPSLNISNAKSTIKRVIKHETEIQVEEIDRLIKKISDNGYRESSMLNNFTSVKNAIAEESTKTKDKYFDGNGNEK
tara:strand:- start:157 stop:447 length:291 start_codon:yes stop_codon:yes gene_type:complete